MTSKIVREDGTEISNIKSVVYTETVNSDDGLRPGCAASATIEVEVYGSQSEAPLSKEALTYYQVDDEGNQTLFGIFYAEPSIPTRGTYKFIAYDAVSKLDKDYSERLDAIQSSFPMTMYALVSDACSYAGVSLGSSSWPLSTQAIQAFYADGLSCRNILQYAAELAGRFVRCDSQGNIIFDWYTTNTSYSIQPGVGENAVAYKQDGLTYDNYSAVRVDSVAVKPFSAEGSAYIYPTTILSVIATDPNGDGNIVLQNINVTDNGNGNLELAVTAEDDNSEGNVEVGSTQITQNPYVISDNLLLTDASDALYNAVAQNIYSIMHSLPAYRHATVSLFPGENPFRAGEFVTITDAQGLTFLTPVFEMVTQASFAELRSYGNRTYDMKVGATKTEAAISAQTNALKETTVELGEAIETEKTAREAAIEALADALASSSGLYSTRESASGGGTIYYLHDQSTLADSTIVIKLTSQALGISTDGGQTYSQGWNFATGTTITNLLIANGIDASQINVTNLDASNITTGTISVGQLPGNVVTSSSSRTQYYLSTSSTTVTGGVWSLSVSWVSGTYIWTRTATTNTYADGTTSTTYSTAVYDENLTSAMSASTSSVGSANAREQTIYRSAASGTISMSAYTTWCTTTSNSQGVWTTRRPTYSSSYPVLFVATQRQTVTQYDSGNGTACSCTTPVIDQTTTVIDGGHITTGTIDAGVVNVTNLSASNITTGTMSSDRIRLYGYMDVFKSSTGSQVGGNIGYMSGSHGFSDGTTESTAGIAMVNETSTQTHYLIVTDSGVRLQEHKNSGADSSSAYLADGRFVIDCETGLIVPRGKLLSNINYGGVPMSRVESIWANTAPTSSFASQTITDSRFLYYDILIFEIAWSSSYPGVVNSAVVYNGSNTTSQGSIIAQPSVTWYNGNYVSAAYRRFTINGSSIAVGSGCHATGTSVSTSADTYAIPIRIMGIMI